MVFIHCIGTGSDSIRTAKGTKPHHFCSKQDGLVCNSSRFRRRHILGRCSHCYARDKGSEVEPERDDSEPLENQEMEQNEWEKLSISRPLLPFVPKVERVSSAPPTYSKEKSSFAAFHQTYAIIKDLGQGSYSTVQQVTSRRSRKAYACKIVDKSSLSSIDRHALAHEIEVLRAVNHVNIIKLHDVIEDDIKCYMVLELANQGDLFDRIANRAKLSSAEAQEFASALVEAIHHCHSNCIIHRDIKPENVLLHEEAGLKLGDFGFAMRLKTKDEKLADSCGTPGYAAPEILRGKLYGIEADIFSLGVLLYILICGYPPFPMKLNELRGHCFNVRFPYKEWHNINPDLILLLTSMLAVNPSSRPTINEVRNHSWVLKGKSILDSKLNKLSIQRQVEKKELQAKVVAALEKRLFSRSPRVDLNGVDLIRHDNQGLAYNIIIRLSMDEKALKWQRKKNAFLSYGRALSGFYGLAKMSLRMSGYYKEYMNEHKNVHKMKGTKCRSLFGKFENHVLQLHPAMRRFAEVSGVNSVRSVSSALEIEATCEGDCTVDEDGQISDLECTSAAVEIKFNAYGNGKTASHHEGILINTDGQDIDMTPHPTRSLSPIDLEDAGQKYSKRSIESPHLGQDNVILLADIIQIIIAGEAACCDCQMEISSNVEVVDVACPVIKTASVTPVCLSPRDMYLVTRDDAFHLEFPDQITRDGFSCILNRLCQQSVMSYVGVSNERGC